MVHHIVGFTGTRDGMTEDQEISFRYLIQELEPWEFHHGDCVGADEQAATYVWENDGAHIHSHPCNIRHMRAHTQANNEYTEKPPLTRNKDIVDACSVLIVAPKEFKEQKRNGTWSTFRYALKRQKQGVKITIIVVLPDGRQDEYIPQPVNEGRTR